MTEPERTPIWHINYPLDCEWEYVRTVTQTDVEMFANITGDTNPMHTSERFINELNRARVAQMKAPLFDGRVVHGAYVAAMVSTIFGTLMEDPVLYVKQVSEWKAPAYIGDTLTATAYSRKYHKTKNGVVVFDTWVRNQRGVLLLSGEAQIRVPTK